MTTHTQCEHAQTEALDALADSQYLAGVKAGWNAANSDDPNTAFQQLHDSRAGYLKPLHAQPAAPQGVAYAELPTPESYLFQHDETGLTQFVDAQQVEWGFQQNNPRLRRIGGAYTADQMRDFADRTHALRVASNWQAPAGATVRHLEAVIKDAADKLEAAMRCHPNAVETLTREALEILHGDPEPFTTAQAAPAPVLHLVHDAFAEVAMAFPEAYALHKVGIADTAVREALAAPAADPAYSEACSLANALFEKHYRQEPDYASGRVVWSLCDTTAGVISQIDNMVSGLARAPAAGAVAGMPPGISALMCVISSLRDTAHFSDEEGELTDELRTLRDWAMTQAAAPTPAAQADSQPAPVAAFEVADAMADSQYLAGVSAGWNAANADDPNAALQKLHESRAGYLKPLSAARDPADSVLEDAARLEFEMQHGSAIGAAMNKGGAA